MSHRFGWRGMMALLAIAVPSILFAQSTEPPSKELRVLERFIGSWHETVTTNPSPSNPQKTTTTITGSRQWILDMHMIENKGTWSHDNRQFLHLITYDPKQMNYIQWYYDKGTLVPQESRGTWDEATQTFTFKGTAGDGLQTSSVQKFLDADNFTWTLVAKDQSGNVVVDVEAKCVRKK